VQPGKTKKAKSPVPEVEASSGNVFVDLDVPDAEEALAKAELAQRICTILSKRKLTQARAAALLGVDQPKVSALIRGKLGGFSTDRLFRFLNALGQDVEIVVRPRQEENGHASTRVVNQ
jgi:predicted XRE-type DNA-binding protein